MAVAPTPAVAHRLGRPHIHFPHISLSLEPCSNTTFTVTDGNGTRYGAICGHAAHCGCPGRRVGRTQWSSLCVTSRKLWRVFMWTSEVALQHYYCMGDMASKSIQNASARPETKKVLPFRYQFAAGAAAGISEVSLLTIWPAWCLCRLDLGDVRQAPLPRTMTPD